MERENESEYRTDLQQLIKLHNELLKHVDPPLPDGLESSSSTHQNFYNQLSSFTTHNHQLYQLLQLMDRKYSESVQVLEERITRLERELFKLRDHHYGVKISEIVEQEEVKSPTFRLAQSWKAKSFIHIEEEDEPLLDNDETKLSIVLETNSPATKHKQPQYRQVQFDQTKLNYDEGRDDDRQKDYSKIDEIYLQQIRTQIFQLKQIIEKTHNISLHQDIPQLDHHDPNCDTQIRFLGRQPSKLSSNAFEHLRNQNSKLRQKMNNYKQQLKSAQKQLKHIRQLLAEGGLYLQTVD